MKSTSGWVPAGVFLASVVAAVLALLALRRWSDQEALGRAKSHAQAHLLEFRLFMDDPLDYLAVARARRSRTTPGSWDSFQASVDRQHSHGAAPLANGRAVWSGSAACGGRQPSSPGRPGRTRSKRPTASPVETPSVHIRATGETCWRICALRNTAGLFRAGSAQTRIVVGNGVAYLPEPLIGRPDLSIGYPRATVFGLHWLVWFLLLSTVAGFAFRRPLRVVF